MEWIVGEAFRRELNAECGGQSFVRKLKSGGMFLQLTSKQIKQSVI